ncbi:MAG TPA: YetF domain-containing protein [Gemmatimonadaceae bacterium]|nr:YetF domain-containing protein [Gemmatimonadaceae bacterium]
MAPRMKKQAAAPPELPKLSRSLRFGWAQTVGLGLLVLVPVLVLFKVWGQGGALMETVIRIAFIYVFLMIALRAMGKRELSKMSAIELVMLLLIPELFSQAAIGEDISMTNAVVATATLLTLVLLTSIVSHLYTRAHSVISGTPTVLVRSGRYIEENMNRERIAPEELLAEMHKAGYERLDQIKWAILEDDGRISLIPVEGEHDPQNLDDDADPA